MSSPTVSWTGFARRPQANGPSTRERWFVYSWALMALTLVTSLSPIGLLPLIAIWAIERLHKILRQDAFRPIFWLPSHSVVWGTRALLIVMLGSAFAAPKPYNAIGATLAFLLTSYFGLASAVYFNRNEYFFRRYVVLPMAGGAALCSIALLVLFLIHMDRVTLFGLNPNLVSTFLLVAVGLCSGHLETWKANGKMWVVAWQALLAMGIFATQSQGALLGLAVFLVIYSLRSFKRALAAVVIIAVLLTLMLAGILPIDLGPDPYRLLLWDSSLRMMMSHPWLGIGMNNFAGVSGTLAAADPTMHSSTHAHSVFMQLAAETGVFGLGLFTLIVGVTAYQGVRLLLRSYDPVNLGLVGMFTSLVARDLVDLNLIYVMGVDLAFWLGVGFILWRVQPTHMDAKRRQ